MTDNPEEKTQRPSADPITLRRIRIGNKIAMLSIAITFSLLIFGIPYLAGIRGWYLVPAAIIGLLVIGLSSMPWNRDDDPPSTRPRG